MLLLPLFAAQVLGAMTADQLLNPQPLSNAKSLVKQLFGKCLYSKAVKQNMDQWYRHFNRNESPSSDVEALRASKQATFYVQDPKAMPLGILFDVDHDVWLRGGSVGIDPMKDTSYLIKWDIHCDGPQGQDLLAKFEVFAHGPTIASNGTWAIQPKTGAKFLHEPMASQKSFTIKEGVSANVKLLDGEPPVFQSKIQLHHSYRDGTRQASDNYFPTVQEIVELMQDAQDA